MRKASLLVLFLTIFIDLLGFGIVIPLLPFYAKQFGATGVWVGIVVGVYSLMQFLFAPMLGRLSDRIGRRPVLLVSLMGSIAGYTLFAFADSLLALMIARIVAGIAGANIGTAHAYIADSTTFENRAKGMGLIGAAFGLGFILGPPIGGLASSWGTARGLHSNLVPGLIAAGLSVIAFSVAFFVLGESKKPGTPPRRGLPPQFDAHTWRIVFGRTALGLVILAQFLVIFCFAGIETTVTLFARDRFQFTARDLGWFFGFMGVIVATIQGGFIGRFSRAVGEQALVAIGTFSFMIGIAVLPWIFNPWMLYPIAFFVAVGQALCYPSMNSLVSKTAPPDQMGSMLGLSASMGSLARLAGPVTYGGLWDAGGAPGAFYTAAAVMFLAFLVAMRLRGHRIVEA